MDFTTADTTAFVKESAKNSTNPVTTNNGLSRYNGTPPVGSDFRIISEVTTAIFAVLLVLGLAANFLVVYVTIVTNRAAKHPIHSIFVLNLAVSDVIFLVISGPYWIVILTVSQWRFGTFLCTFFPFMTTASVCSAIYTICALAWIRFMALAMPFRFRRSCMSRPKAGYIIVFLVWICGFLLSMPYLFSYRLKEEFGVYQCDWVGTEEGARIHSIVKLITNYLVPLVLVIFFYSFVAREVLCYMMHRKSMLGQEQAAERKECTKSTVVMLFLITAFLICWFPHLLETVFSLTGYHNEGKYWRSRLALQLIGKAMAYTHAIVNPIIYTFASPIFRHSLRRSLSEKMRSCRDATARNKTKTYSRSTDDKRKNKNLNLKRDSNTGVAMTTTAKIYKGTATTPNTEQIHMLTADSHATEITRLASPDLTHAGRKLQPSLDDKDENELLNVQRDNARL